MGTKYSVMGFNCGVGNLLGFQQQDYNVKALVDGRKFIKKGIQTFYKNFPDIVYSEDENEFTEKTHVIVSSPSCAQVSSLGIKREDRRDIWNLALFEFEFVRVLDLLLKKDADFIVIEYLKSLTKYIDINHLGMRLGEDLYKFPEEYRVQIIRLNSINYNVPQKRDRLFLFFSKHKFNFFYMAPVDLKGLPKTNREVLSELDVLREKGTLLNDVWPKHSQDRIEGFRNLKPGESYYGMHNNKKLQPEMVCPTITSHCTRYVHPWHPRTLTVREVATFQGFPLEFEFFGPENMQLDLVGRSISPVVAKHIAEEIKISLDDYYLNRRII